MSFTTIGQTNGSTVFHPLQDFFAQLTSAVAQSATPKNDATPEAAANVITAHKPMGFFKRLGQRIERMEMKRQEAYLAESTDIYDLEHRIKQLEYRRSSNIY
jgi:hypothetical protein